MENAFRLQGGRNSLTESENEQRGRGKRRAAATPKGAFGKVSSGDESDESSTMAKTVFKPQMKIKKPNALKLDKCGSISK